MKRLSREQKKIFYVAFVVILFLFLFWSLVYSPQKRAFVNIKKKLISTEAEIAAIKAITQDKPFAEAVREMNNQLSRLVSKLPFREEEVIRALSELAKKLKIEVRNISLLDKQIIPDKISGYEVRELPISMKLSCEFRALGEYLKNLKSDDSILIRLRELNIDGEGEGHVNLNVNLQLSAYLSEPQSR